MQTQSTSGIEADSADGAGSDAPNTYGSSEELALAQYRAISRTAVVSLALGVASFLALATPALWIVPLAAIVCGIAALIQIRSNPQSYSGQSTATTGLALGLFFLALAPTRIAVHDWIVRSRAEAFAQAWAKLVAEGELNRAHQFAMPPRIRQLDRPSLERYYEMSEQARQERDAFFSNEPINQLVLFGSQGQLELVKTLAVVKSSNRTYVDQLFLLKYRQGDPGVEKSVPLRIVTNRHENTQSGQVDWQVDRILKPGRDLRKHLTPTSASGSNGGRGPNGGSGAG